MFVSLSAPYVVHEEFYTRSCAIESAAGFCDMGVGAVDGRNARRGDLIFN